MDAPTLEGLAPAEMLAVEVLVARRRLGHDRWPFEARAGAVLRRLAARGLVAVDHGPVPRTVVASLTDAGWAAYTAPPVPTPPDSYVVGFLVGADGHVPLVRKNRPASQAGFLNGPGGRIEGGETPAEAMRREFAEGTGIDTVGWSTFAVGRRPGAVVHFLAAVADPGAVDAARSATDERVEVWPAASLSAPHARPYRDVAWLAPMAASRPRHAPPVEFALAGP